MPIRETYKTEAEIPEAHRELFVEQEDGSFALDIEGSGPRKTAADVARLKGSLDAERAAHRETKKKIAAYGELTPEQATELTDRVEELRLQLEAGGGKPDEKLLEPLIQRRAESLLRPVQRELNTTKEEAAKLREDNLRLAQSDQRRRRSDALRAATVGETGIKLRSPSVLEDVELWAERVLEENDQGQFVTRDNLPSGIDPGLPPRELLREVQTRGIRPHWFPENEGAGAVGGAQKTGGGGPDPFTPAAQQGGKATVNMTQFQTIAKADPKRARALAQKYGRADLYPVVDALTSVPR